MTMSAIARRRVAVAVVLVVLGLLAAVGVVGLQSRGTTSGSILSKIASPFGNRNAAGGEGFVAAAKSALGLIAERSPGEREGAQLITKPARMASIGDDLRKAGRHAPRAATRSTVRSRLIPGQPATAPGSAPGDLQIADILPELGTSAGSPETGFVPAGLIVPPGGGGSFTGPGPVFIGGAPAPAAVAPPPPVAEQPTPGSAVPEPATWLLFIFGFAAVASGMRRRPKTALPRPSSGVRWTV